MKKKITRALAFWLSATVTLSAVDMRAFAAEFEADANGGIAIESDDESLSVTYEDLTYEDQIDALAETEDEQAEEWAEADDGENEDNSSENAEKDLTESVFCGGGITYKYIITSTWDSGYNAVVRVENNSGTNVENWEIEMAYDGAIDSIWNASVSSHEDGKYIIKNNGWNKDIPDGGFIEFGISAQEAFEDFPSSFGMLSGIAEKSDDDYGVDYQITDNWGAGFTANLTVTNTSAVTIEDWMLEFDFDGSITNMWNGTILSHEGNHYEIKNNGYNANIASGASVTLGFQGANSLSGRDPENYRLFSFNDRGGVKDQDNLEDISGDNSVSDNTVSDNAVDDNTVSDNTVSDNTVSENTVSDNTVSENTVSGNLVSANADEEPLEFMCEAIRVISEGTGAYILEKGFTYDEMDDISAYVAETYSELINDVSVSNGNTLNITLTNDIIFTYQITDSSEPLNMSRGGMASQFKLNEAAGIDAQVHLKGVPTDNADILLWAPFDSAWGDSDEVDTVRAIVSNGGLDNHLTVVSDAAANVDSLKNLGSYGLIVFASHGAEGKWLATGEAMSDNEAYREDALAGKMCVSSIYDVHTNACDYRWQVSDRWLDENVGSLSNCIVMNNSCESSLNTNICDVLLNKGAKTYLGYNANVTNQYITFETGDILSQLIYDGATTEDAFSITLDAFYGGGSLEIYGYGNVVLPFGQVDMIDEGISHDEELDGVDISDADGIGSMTYSGADGISLASMDISMSTYGIADSAITNRSLEADGISLRSVGKNGTAFSYPAYIVAPSKCEVRGKISLVNMSGKLLWVTGGYVVDADNYVRLQDSLVDNMYVRYFEKGEVVYTDDGGFIRFNVSCYAVSNDNDYIFVPVDLDHHDSLVDAYTVEGWFIPWYMGVGSVIGVNGTEVPYAVTRRFPKQCEVPKYPEALTCQEAVANIASIITGESEYDEAMMRPLTNPSFEDGDTGWNIGYSGGGYNNEALEETGVYSEFKDIVPTDSAFLLKLSTKVNVPSGICAEQRFYLPDGSEKIYFDYNIVESLKVDCIDYITTNNAEYKQHGNIATIDIKTDISDEWECIWSDCIDDYDDMSKLTVIDSSIYSYMVTTGWKAGCIDVSAYSGHNISIRISINAAQYEFFETSKLLVDNIRITNSADSRNEIITSYEVISDKNLPAYIRELGIDTEGRSHVLYTSVFEDEPEDGGKPEYQASWARIDLMYRHRYEDISQVGFYLIETEDDFYNTWGDMPENSNTKKIDEVVVVIHGKYYAMMINAGAKENLTVSPDGKVGSDLSALRISDLPVRNIETIRLSSCNTGLLDAINLNDDKEMDEKVESGGTYQTRGNVAQAFLESQNVHEVYAWDGNMNPRTVYGGDRLSHTQGEFHSALEYFEEGNMQVIDVQRTQWIDRKSDIDFGLRDKPMGLVRYVKENGQQYCTYEFEIQTTSNGIYLNNIEVYGYVNLETSYHEQFLNEEDRNNMINVTN